MLIVILVGIGVFLFYHFFLEFYAYWDTYPEASYVFLIPLFSAYIIWVQRDRFKRLQFNKYNSFSKNGLILLIGGLILFIIGNFTYVLFVKTVAFIVIIAASILFLYGKELFRIVLFPVLFLSFMLPIPTPVYQAVAEPLKYFIADFTTTILSLLNIPVFIEGNVIYLPSISLLIHESCSGIQTVISLLAISSAFAYLFLKSYRYRIAIIAMAVPLGILVNVLRIVMIGILSFLYSSNIAMTFHEYAWILVTPVGIFATFLGGYILRCHELKNI